MRILIRTLSFIFMLLVYSCGSTILIENEDISGFNDNTSIYDSSSDIEELTDLPDINNSEPLDDTGISVQCKELYSCNDLLTKEEYCERECIFQEHHLICEGEKFNSLCYRLEIPGKPEQPDTINDIKISPPQIPDYVMVGDRLELMLTLTNLSGTPGKLHYAFKNPDNWEIYPLNFEQEGDLLFEPNESKDLRFNANAIKPNVFNIYYSPIISFYFNGNNYELFSTVLFNQNNEYLFCDDRYFPETYCEYPECTDYALYYSAVCCENIFYPGAQCCSDSDCTSGVCIDGKCIYNTPTIALANTSLIQNNKILVIISDFEEFPEKDLCKNKSEELKEKLQIEVIENFYKTIIEKRTKRKDILNFKWEVLSGFKKEKFIKNNQYDFNTFRESLQHYIKDELGCNINFEEYDKLIIISPFLDLMGFSGMAFGLGYIGQVIYSNGYLTAHELAHSFGATDLYLDMGGRFQYILTLMGNNLGGYGFPEDKVTWAEIGLGDIDKNGVIDIFEFAKFPESIEIRDIKANLTYKDTLEISFDPYLLENNNLKKGIFYKFYIELPEYNAIREIYADTTTVFDQYEVDLNKIREAGKIKIRMVTTYRYSDRDLKNIVLNFDKTFDVNVGEIKK